MPAFEFEYLSQDEQTLSDLQAAPFLYLTTLHINVICLALRKYLEQQFSFYWHI